MKKFIALSAIAALTTGAFADDDMAKKIAELEKQLEALKTQMTVIKDQGKQIQALNTKVNEVKAHDANDNIKFNVDFRTSVDSINYKLAGGGEAKNPDLLTNRLWLNMGYAPEDNVIFKGTLSYLKAYGDSPSHSQANIGGATSLQYFDWVTNENANDNTLKVKEAYWLYTNDTFLGTPVAWSASIGRRPSTDGLGINLRANMEAKSPLAHTVNVEFDGASFKYNLDKVTPMVGSWIKFCLGRGITNAKARFDMSGTDYASDDTKTKDNNMYGFIFVPYDDGQYSVWTNWARATHMIGFDMTGYNPTNPATWKFFNTANGQYVFNDFGDLDLFTTMLKAEGIGSGVNDFLDNTKAFVSFAQSKTNPNGTGGMLGSSNSETGHSWWVGINTPCLLSEDGRIGVEWNKGSKYWRSVTYGEDTMAGSKIAARGSAFEVYYNKPLTKALSTNISYTKIKYDYTGSNKFFGDDGTPYDISSTDATGQVKEARDIKASISYRF